jgi:predicted ATP-dependent serine protease
VGDDGMTDEPPITHWFCTACGYGRPQGKGRCPECNGCEFSLSSNVITRGRKERGLKTAFDDEQ